MRIVTGRDRTAPPFADRSRPWIMPLHPTIAACTRRRPDRGEARHTGADTLRGDGSAVAGHRIANRRSPGPSPRCRPTSPRRRRRRPAGGGRRRPPPRRAGSGSVPGRRSGDSPRAGGGESTGGEFARGSVGVIEVARGCDDMDVLFSQLPGDGVADTAGGARQQDGGVRPQNALWPAHGAAQSNRAAAAPVRRGIWPASP